MAFDGFFGDEENTNPTALNDFLAAEKKRTQTDLSRSRKNQTSNVKVTHSNKVNQTLPASIDPTGRRSTTSSQYTDAPDNKNLYETADRRFREENYNRLNSTLVEPKEAATRADERQSSGTQRAEAVYKEQEQQERKQATAKQAVMQQKLQAQKVAEAEAESEISVPGLIPHKHISRTEGMMAALSVNGALFNLWMLILVPMGLLNLFTYGIMSATPTWIDKIIDWLGYNYADSQHLFGITFAVQFAAIMISILIAGTMLKFRGIHPLHGNQGSGFKQLTFLLSVIVCFFPGGALLPVFMVWVFVAGVNPN